MRKEKEKSMTYHCDAPARHDGPQNRGGDLDVGFSENTPVEQEDGELGEAQDERVEDLAHEEVNEEVRDALRTVARDVRSHSPAHPCWSLARGSGVGAQVSE